MAKTKTVEEIIAAMRTLGVTSPAIAFDVLNAAQLILSPMELAAVVNGVVIEVERAAPRPTG